MALTEAQKRAKAKYREKTKSNFQRIGIDLNKTKDMDIINVLEIQKDKSAYIKEAIRYYIKDTKNK